MWPSRLLAPAIVVVGKPNSPNSLRGAQENKRTTNPGRLSTLVQWCHTAKTRSYLWVENVDVIKLLTVRFTSTLLHN